MMECCEICMKPVQWPSHYGDWECPHCHQPYSYDESHQIRLTDAQLALLRNPPRWIRVEERLPEDGTWCWVNWDGPGKPFPAMRDSHSAGGWTNSDTWEDFRKEVTRWMPLPEPPEVK